MANNIQEEQLDDPVNTQPENISDQLTTAADTETILQNQEIENMEVHHHPDLHHKPKKWKEYFLEFLMLFLAVTMGFFAENIRENYVEHKRAREYASLLIEDLATDTVAFNNAARVMN